MYRLKWLFKVEGLMKTLALKLRNQLSRPILPEQEVTLAIHNLKDSSISLHCNKSSTSQQTQKQLHTKKKYYWLSIASSNQNHKLKFQDLQETSSCGSQLLRLQKEGMVKLLSNELQDLLKEKRRHISVCLRRRVVIRANNKRCKVSREVKKTQLYKTCLKSFQVAANWKYL